VSTQKPRRVFVSYSGDDHPAKDFMRLLAEIGLDVVNYDDLESGTSIRRTIENELSRADVVVADLTGSNPNVFYELGLARGLNIPAIIVIDRKEDLELPTDVASSQVIFYDSKNLSSFIESVNRAVLRLSSRAS
jgi:predicted nucleotide-binding protein